MHQEHVQHLLASSAPRRVQVRFHYYRFCMTLFPYTPYLLSNQRLPLRSAPISRKGFSHSTHTVCPEVVYLVFRQYYFHLLPIHFGRCQPLPAASSPLPLWSESDDKVLISRAGGKEPAVEQISVPCITERLPMIR